MKHLLTIVLLLTACLCSNAENYPYRSDYLWVTVPDHHDWLYRIGEKVTVEVQLYKHDDIATGMGRQERCLSGRFAGWSVEMQPSTALWIGSSSIL